MVLSDGLETRSSKVRSVEEGGRERRGFGLAESDWLTPLMSTLRGGTGSSLVMGRSWWAGLSSRQRLLCPRSSGNLGPAWLTHRPRVVRPLTAPAQASGTSPPPGQVWWAMKHCEEAEKREEREEKRREKQTNNGEKIQRENGCWGAWFGLKAARFKNTKCRAACGPHGVACVALRRDLAPFAGAGQRRNRLWGLLPARCRRPNLRNGAMSRGLQKMSCFGQ